MKEYLQDYIKDTPRVRVYSEPSYSIDWVRDVFMLPIYLGILALNLFIWVYLPYRVVSALYHAGGGGVGGFWVVFGFVWVVLAVLFAVVTAD